MNQTQRTLTARIIGTHWHVTDTEPRVRELFGTDTLPMPHSARVPARQWGGLQS